MSTQLVKPFPTAKLTIKGIEFDVETLRIDSYSTNQHMPKMGRTSAFNTPVKRVSAHAYITSNLEQIHQFENTEVDRIDIISGAEEHNLSQARILGMLPDSNELEIEAHSYK